MARKRTRTVFFPWEVRGGFVASFGRARVRIVVLSALAIALVVLVEVRASYKSALRTTRAAITTATVAIDSYRADRGGCPQSFGELVAHRYVQHVPMDGWGSELRFACSVQDDVPTVAVWSDSPRGERVY